MKPASSVCPKPLYPGDGDGTEKVVRDGVFSARFLPTERRRQYPQHYPLSILLQLRIPSRPCEDRVPLRVLRVRQGEQLII